MTLHLVRHAQAGERAEWDAPDELRPLTERGRRQAEALGRRLAGATRVVSSPYVRCVQTVEPVAEAAGLEVEPHHALAEGAPFEESLSLLASLPDEAVLCTHGDVYQAVVEALVRRGMAVEGEPDWRKASCWELERDAEGTVVAGRALPPPDRDARPSAL